MPRNQRWQGSLTILNNRHTSEYSGIAKTVTDAQCEAKVPLGFTGVSDVRFGDPCLSSYSISH